MGVLRGVVGRRDPLVSVAWMCVAGGILLALVLTAWTIRTIRGYEYLAVEGWRHPAEIERVRAYYTQKAEAASYWPGIIGGACVSGFGVLLLALRRPHP